MSAFHSFERSAFGVFTESPFHVRNARSPKCRLQVCAEQGVIGFLPFDYVAGDEVTGVYMTKSRKTTWGMADGCDEHWSTLTESYHRKFADGQAYQTSLENSCDGLVRSYSISDTGVETNYYNPAVYTEGVNCLGSPCVFGLDPTQECVVWFDPLFGYTDSRTQSHAGWDVADTATLCGQASGTYNGTPSVSATSHVTNIFRNEDDMQVGKVEVTLSDWFPKVGTGDPLIPGWDEVTLELLRQATFARRSYVDMDDSVTKTFGCGLADTDTFSLYWKRGPAPHVGFRTGTFPDLAMSPVWGVATQMDLLDWCSVDSGGPDTGAYNTLILAKKSRLFEPLCKVFVPQIYDDAGSPCYLFDYDAAECSASGPLSGWQDILPTVRFGDTWVLSPNGPGTMCDCCPDPDDCPP